MSLSKLNAELRPIVGAFFDETILEGFGCGIYTLILGQAIWKLHRKGNNAFYAFSLILLWISTIFGVACTSTKLRGGFVVHNGSPVEIFEGFQLTSAVTVGEYISQILCILIADAILIWRCNILWQSKFILILLLTLYVTTAAFYITTSITSDHIAVLLGCIAPLASAMTTIIATCLITLKILLVTRKSPMRRSYARIIEIIVESGAIVSMLLLAEAVLQLISFFHPLNLATSSGKIVVQMTVYIASIHYPIIPVAPTLIAFRVAEEPPRTEVHGTSRSSRLSRLTFRRNARNTTYDSQARDPHISTIRFMSAQEEEDLSNSQGSMGMQAQSDHQGEKRNLEVMSRLTGVEPAMV